MVMAGDAIRGVPTAEILGDPPAEMTGETMAMEGTQEVDAGKGMVVGTCILLSMTVNEYVRDPWRYTN
jgi:hypothetical protein